MHGTCFIGLYAGKDGHSLKNGGKRIVWQMKHESTSVNMQTPFGYVLQVISSASHRPANTITHDEAQAEEAKINI